MARFRYHRYTLEESLKTEIQVNSLKELKERFNNSHDVFPKIKTLRCFFYCKDDRIHGYENTFMVMVRYENDKEEYPLGFSDEQLN